MSWTAYLVVLRVEAPLHIGVGMVGNLQRTRSYVIGRNLWGSLTACLTRRSQEDTTPDYDAYQAMGQCLHKTLAYTYFYPTSDPQGSIRMWPWERNFRYNFLSTYASTALNYRVVTAEDASLHEVEYIMPYTRPDGAPVYLAGYIFQSPSAPDWQSSLKCLQVGGERGYGWGYLTITMIDKLKDKLVDIFDTGHQAYCNNGGVYIDLSADNRLLAHTLAADFDARPGLPSDVIDGSVEPLVGRETLSNGSFGKHISRAQVCYAPGGYINRQTTILIGPYGVWEHVN